MNTTLNRILGRRVGFATVLMTLMVLPASARPLHHALRGAHSRMAPLVMNVLLTPGTLPEAGADFTLKGKEYRLNLRHMHTGESLSVVYRIGDTYVPSAMDALNLFLRDHRNDKVSVYSPSEFDLLYNLMGRLGKQKDEIDVVCGYRSPESNEMLRNSGPNTGVAEHSQHIQAKAIDIRVPGVQTARLRNAALSLEAGGVGYYPSSQFVHVDVGPVREWTFGNVSRRRGSRGHVRSRVSSRSHSVGHKPRHHQA